MSENSWNARRQSWSGEMTVKHAIEAPGSR